LFTFPGGNSGVGLWFRSATPAPLAAQGELAQRNGEAELTVQTPTAALEVTQLLLDSVRALRDYEYGSYVPRMAPVKALAHRLEQAPPEVVADLAKVGLTQQRLLEWLTPSVESIDGGKAIRWTRRSVLPGVLYSLTVRPEGDTMIQRPAGTAIRFVSPSGLVRLRVAASVKGFPRLEPIEEATGSLATSRQGNGRSSLLSPEGLRCVRAAEAKGAAAAARISSALRILTWLSTKTKLLAGSWTYLTYFGRDTLITLHALAPLLDHDALQAGLVSVLQRLGTGPEDGGSVAHEENLGDQAVLDHITQAAKLAEWRLARAELLNLAAPVFEYKMVDSDMYLPLVARDYLARAPSVRTRALFRGPVGDPARPDRTNLDALFENFGRIVRIAEPYAMAWEQGKRGEALVPLLVSLKKNEIVGDWRDSREGLGLGRTPGSVNIGLMAASLRAVAHVTDALTRLALPGAAAWSASIGGTARLARLAEAWDHAEEHFRVTVSEAELRQRLGRYLEGSRWSPAERTFLQQVAVEGTTVGEFVQGKATVASLRNGLTFWAVALDGHGKPIPVQSNDVGMYLHDVDSLTPVAVEATRVLALPYPIGLATPVGTLVANPALSSRPEDYALFARDRYHGVVVWSWPMALAELALGKWLGYGGGKAPTRGALRVPPGQRAPLEAAWNAIRQARETIGAFHAYELWSWRIDSISPAPPPTTGAASAAPWTMRPIAFGSGSNDVTEANPVQLWSSLSLATTCNAP
jgi:hypothetical protein